MADTFKVLRRFERALELVHAALAEAESAGDAATIADTLRSNAAIELERGHAREAMALYRRSLDIAEAHDLADRAGKALDGLGQASRVLGLYDDARAFYQRSSEYAERTGDRRMLAILLNNMASLASRTGELDQAHELLVRGSAIFETTGSTRLATLARANLGGIAVARGDADGALEQYATALASARQMDDAALVAGILQSRASVLYGLRRTREAWEALDESFLVLEAVDDPLMRAEAELLAAKLAIADDALDTAEAHLTRTSSIAAGVDDVELDAAVDGWRGMLAVARARMAVEPDRSALLDDARAALERCIATFESLGHRDAAEWRRRLEDLGYG